MAVGTSGSPVGPSSVNVLLYCSLAETQTCCSILVTQSPCFLNESKAAERCLVSGVTNSSSKFSWKAICLLPIKQSVHELYRGFELTKQMSPSRWQPQPSSAQEPELAGRLVCWPFCTHFASQPSWGNREISILCSSPAFYVKKFFQDLIPALNPPASDPFPTHAPLTPRL